jgi:hypothetical protein
MTGADLQCIFEGCELDADELFLTATKVQNIPQEMFLRF